MIHLLLPNSSEASYRHAPLDVRITKRRELVKKAELIKLAATIGIIVAVILAVLIPHTFTFLFSLATFVLLHDVYAIAERGRKLFKGQEKPASGCILSPQDGLFFREKFTSTTWILAPLMKRLSTEKFDNQLYDYYQHLVSYQKHPLNRDPDPIEPEI